MRAAAPLLLLLLGACQREPSFDERYAKIAHDLRASSAAIDADLASEAATTRLVEATSSATPNPVPASPPRAR